MTDGPSAGRGGAIRLGRVPAVAEGAPNRSFRLALYGGAVVGYGGLHGDCPGSWGAREDVRHRVTELNMSVLRFPASASAASSPTAGPYVRKVFRTNAR